MTQERSTYLKIESWFVVTSLILVVSAVVLSPVAFGVERAFNAAANRANAKEAREIAEKAKAVITEQEPKIRQLREIETAEQASQRTRILDCYVSVFFYEFCYGDRDEAKNWATKACEFDAQTDTSYLTDRYDVNEFTLKSSLGSASPSDQSKVRDALRMWLTCSIRATNF